jgi:ABC-type transport system substrate-binding protein
MPSTQRTTDPRAKRCPGAWVGLLLPLLAGCPDPPDGPRFEGAGHEGPQDGGTFTFFHESNVRSLDPHIAYDELSIMAVRLLFDGLLDYDENADLVPRLAEAMPEVSDDGMTFRFRIRPGVTFHNGRTMTADDVRWSLERMLHPDTGSPGWPFYRHLVGLDAYRAGDAPHVEGIRTIGPHTLELTIAEPDQTFLYSLAMTFAYPVPRESYRSRSAGVDQHPVGTGPFRLVDWERGVRILFERHPRYWQPGKPHVDHMVFLENTPRDVAAMRFRNGGIDHLHRFSPPDSVFFRSAPKWQPYQVKKPTITTHGMFLNCEMAPFDDVHVRRAVAHAINRERWSRARSRQLLPTGQMLPPQLMGYREDLPHAQRFDLDRAREEMRLAGYPDGLPSPVTLWVSEHSTGRFFGELAQEDLRKIGIQVRIRPVSFAVYLQETAKPGRVQMAFTGWNLDFPDPSNFLFLFHSRSIDPHDSENRAFYRNAELDTLLDAALVEADPDERRRMYEQANDIVARDAPWAFIYHPLDLQVWQPYVRNYEMNPVWGKDYRDVWLDLPRRRIAAHTAPRPTLASWLGLEGLLP